MQTRIMNLRDAGIKLSCAFCLRIQLTYLEVEFSVAPSAAPWNCLTNVIFTSTRLMTPMRRPAPQSKPG